MTMTKCSNYYGGLDLLKFVLALFIVAAHTNLFVEYPILHQLINPLLQLAVPSFFAISSYLFYEKASKTDIKELDALELNHLKRLLLFFVIWYILLLPKTYFAYFSIATWKEIVYAMVFNSTLSGGWFIKALIINNIILFFMIKKNWVTVGSSFFIVLYIVLALGYTSVLNNFSRLFSPYFSFYYHTGFYCVGALIFKYKQSLCFSSKYLLLFFIFLFILDYVSNVGDVLYRLLIPVVTILYFLQFRTKTDYRLLRKTSIIIYILHFAVIWCYNEGCKLWLESDSTPYIVLQYSITRFAIILSLCIVIALLILKFEKKPHLAFLKYLH